jgi:hypothetical protein
MIGFVAYMVLSYFVLLLAFPFIPLDSPELTGLSSMMAVLLSIATTRWAPRFTHSCVYLYKRGSKPGFWQSKGETRTWEIVKIVLAAVLGSALTLVVQRLTK